MKSVEDLMEEDKLFAVIITLQYCIDLYSLTIDKYPELQLDENVQQAVEFLNAANDIVWSMTDENNKNIVAH